MPQPKDKDWLNGYKNKTPTYVVYKRPTSKQDTYRLKVKGWKKIFHANRDQKKAGVGILISDKTLGFRVHHQLPRFTQTHVHQVSDAIQPSHPLSSPSPPAPNPSQHQSLFQ